MGVTGRIASIRKASALELLLLIFPKIGPARTKVTRRHTERHTEREKRTRAWLWATSQVCLKTDKDLDPDQISAFNCVYNLNSRLPLRIILPLFRWQRRLQRRPSWTERRMTTRMRKDKCNQDESITSVSSPASPSAFFHPPLVRPPARPTVRPPAGPPPVCRRPTAARPLTRSFGRAECAACLHCWKAH